MAIIATRTIRTRALIVATPCQRPVELLFFESAGIPDTDWKLRGLKYSATRRMFWTNPAADGSGFGKTIQLALHPKFDNPPPTGTAPGPTGEASCSEQVAPGNVRRANSDCVDGPSSATPRATTPPLRSRELRAQARRRTQRRTDKTTTTSTRATRRPPRTTASTWTSKTSSWYKASPLGKVPDTGSCTRTRCCRPAAVSAREQRRGATCRLQSLCDHPGCNYIWS